jgi:hypothetical protein
VGWLVEWGSVYTLWDADEKNNNQLMSSPLPVALFTAYFGACMAHLMAVVSLLASALMPTQAASSDGLHDHDHQWLPP